MDSYRDFFDGVKACAERRLPKSTCENALFAAFHLVEAACAAFGKHIDKHTRAAWKIENDIEIRPVFEGVCAKGR